jgi:RNA recognition motif-containing protein
MAANNQAQMLMLLNQANLENQLKMSNMAQSQPMGMNSSNILSMMNLLKAVQNSKATAMNGNRRGSGMSCYNCGREGHMAKECKKPKSSGMSCYNCNQEGHMAKECKKPKNFNRGQASGKPTMNLANLLSSLAGGEVPSLAGGQVQDERGRCVWVTGIPEDYQDADKLLNIFGNFGNVRKIVFSGKKADGALIELDDSRGAIKAVGNMNGQKLNGQAIKVSFTKIDSAGMKAEDAKSKDVRKAKENWRFTGNKDSKFRKICMSRLRKLSSFVLVSNVPEGKSDLMKKHIIESGYTVKSIEASQRPEDKDKPKPSTGYTMSLVELASVEEAIAAVANLHNTWPKKFGAMKNDKFGNSRGLVFSLAGVKREKSKA